MESRADRDRCSYFETLFSPYIDGGLDAPERKALAEHLHQCEACAEQFGTTWRRAAGQSATTSPSRHRRRGARWGPWVLMLGCLFGVAVLGAVGLLDSAERGPDLLQSKERGLVGREIAQMVAVQTELLKAVVGPLRGSEQHVSHAVKGEALDFFERLGKTKTPAAELHTHFRASDPEPGGRDWDRAEFTAKLGAEGVPGVVLAGVPAAFREVILCRITWGDRPAYAWLLRERLSKDEPGEDPTFKLAYLLLARP